MLQAEGETDMLSGGWRNARKRKEPHRIQCGCVQWATWLTWARVSGEARETQWPEPVEHYMLYRNLGLVPGTVGAIKAFSDRYLAWSDFCFRKFLLATV